MWLPCLNSVKTHLKQGLVYRCVFLFSLDALFVIISNMQSIIIIATRAIFIYTCIYIIAINISSITICVTSNLLIGYQGLRQPHLLILISYKEQYIITITVCPPKDFDIIRLLFQVTFFPSRKVTLFHFLLNSNQRI